jgi:hypothetical protein
MKKIALIFAILILTAVWSIAQDGPAVDGDALWKDISVISPYTQWGQWPDHTGIQAGKAPHGPFHIVYVNKVGLTKGHPKPYGTIVVKENYTPAKELAAITVMYKVKGDNPDAGDWFWVKYAPDGTVQKAGKPAGCVNCHRVRAEQDFIMVSDY